MKGIYKYTDLETNEVVYIGKDSHIDKKARHKDHMRLSLYNKQPFNRVLHGYINISMIMENIKKSKAFLLKNLKRKLKRKDYHGGK